MQSALSAAGPCGRLCLQAAKPFLVRWHALEDDSEDINWSAGAEHKTKLCLPHGHVMCLASSVSCALPWGSRSEGPECNGGSGPPHGMSSGHRMGHLSGQLCSVEATTLGIAYGGRPGLGMAGTLRRVACTPPPQNTHTQTVGPDYSTVLDMVSPVGAVGGGGGGGPPCGERLGGRFGNGGERLSPRRGKGGRAPNAFLWVFCWPRP